MLPKLAIIPLLSVLFACGQATQEQAKDSLQAPSITLYSARKEQLIQPLLDKFTAQTGVRVNLLTGSADALISRIQSEGNLTPADALITTDVGRLVKANDLMLTASMVGINTRLDALLAEQAIVTDHQGRWVAITKRARPIFYAPERVNTTELTRLEDLANERFRGRICIRSASNVYNQSLVASFLLAHGESATQAWLEGLVANFARPPKGGDRDQIKAIVAGQCDLAIANTYYVAGMRNDKDQATRDIGQAVKVFWPNQNDRGAHINISGIALVKHSQKAQYVTQLVEFMLSEESQAWYAEVNQEYPVRSSVTWSKTLQAMGQFRADPVDLNDVGAHNAQALKLMQQAGWL